MISCRCQPWALPSDESVEWGRNDKAHFDVGARGLRSVLSREWVLLVLRLEVKRVHGSFVHWYVWLSVWLGSWHVLLLFIYQMSITCSPFDVQLSVCRWNCCCCCLFGIFSRKILFLQFHCFGIYLTDPNCMTQFGVIITNAKLKRNMHTATDWLRFRANINGERVLVHQMQLKLNSKLKECDAKIKFNFVDAWATVCIPLSTKIRAGRQVHVGHPPLPS